VAWLVLPLVFILPGYLTLAAWGRRGKELDFWEALFLVPFVSILLTSWLGLAMAELGVFSLSLLATLLALYCVALLFWAKKRLELGWMPRPSLSITTCLFLLVLAFAAWAYARPAEVLAGTFDPGIYLSTGANIATRGTIAFTDPSLSDLSQGMRLYLLEQRWEEGIGAVRLSAFWLPDYHGERVIPAFFHLFPVWLAILYSMGGAAASLFVSPLFGLLGVWATFLLGKRLVSPGVGLLAAGLLSANVGQLWFARYPISEATVQMLLLGGLVAFLLMVDLRSRLLAFVSGAALGLVHLAKLDQVFLPAAVFLIFFVLWLLGRFERRYWYFLLPYGLLLTHSLLHILFFAFGYTWLNLSPFLPRLTSRPALALYAIAVGLLVAVAAGRSHLGGLPGWCHTHRVHLSLALAVATGLGALYAYFLWPLNPDVTATPFLSSDGVTPVYLRMYREEGLVRLGWYLTPLGLALGLAGFVLFVAAKAGLRSSILLLLFVAQLTLYLLTAGLAYPVHFWAVRRYVPLVFPAFALFAAFSLWRLCPSLQPKVGQSLRRWSRALLAVILAVALLANFLWVSLPVLSHTEYEGALVGLGRWAAQMRDPAVVLFKPRSEGNVFAAPLQFLFHKTSFVLRKEPDEAFFAGAVAHWLEEGKQVYLVLSDEYPRFLAGRYDYRLVNEQELAFRAMEQGLDHLPRQVLPLRFTLRLIQIQPRAETGLPYRLRIGPMWMADSLRLRLPRPDPAVAGLRVAFRARGQPPGGGPRAQVTLLVDGQPRYRVTLAQDFQEYQALIPLEAGVVGDLEVTLAAEPGNPAAEGADSSAVGRGVMLEWLQIEEARAWPQNLRR
jgi:hypothetical protein